MAARRNKRMVTMREFEDSKDKVMMGAERRIAGHDRGREAPDRLSRGRPRHRRAATFRRPIPSTRRRSFRAAVPSAWSCSCPERDKLSMSYEQMTSRLAIMMGGRIAEEITFGTGQGHVRRRVRHRAGDAPCARHGHALGLLGGARHASPMARTRRRCSWVTPCRASRTSRKRPPARSTLKSGAWSRWASTRRGVFFRRSTPIWRRSPRACSNTRRFRARKSAACSLGKPPIRDIGDDTPPSRPSVVPTTRGPRPEGRYRPGAAAAVLMPAGCR